MTSKTINIIIPYFGKFPNYFPLFLNSCAYNNTVNWTIITDNTAMYNYPVNVQKIEMSFYDVQQLIRSKFDFDVAINSVHKLCELKPAYGYIFDELIVGYDYWGYGDLDLIYGDMRSFLTDDILTYDKIFTLGHLSLVRNTEEINRLFMREIFGKELYKEAFSNDQNYNFDEEFMGKPNINSIFREYGYSVWEKSFAADIHTKSSSFVLDIGDGASEPKKKNFFVWNEGVLNRYYLTRNDVVNHDEYLYIHLQKRKMKTNNIEDMNCFKIIPNEFANLEVDVNEIEENFHKIRCKRLNNQYWIIRYKNFVVKLNNFFDRGDK